VTALSPLDVHNQKLRSQVHPTDWENPIPDGRYNLVVIGAGTAGLVCAAGAAGLGAKVALIERDLLGGDCLNVGCVPSKGLIAAARVAAQAKQAAVFGVHARDVQVDFPAVMDRMRKLRAEIAANDSAARFQKLGVDVFFGQANFVSESTIQVGDNALQFSKAAVCTGARPTAPAIPGLDRVPYLTNETLFSLTELPRRMAVVGAGPIGCEMAQTFASFGSEVILIETQSGILPKDDRDAAAIVRNALIRSGVRILCCGRQMSVEPDQGGIRICLQNGNDSIVETVDHLLVAAGRAPNIESLGLDQAGIEHDPTGIRVNHFLQTTNRRVFAAGDVCSTYKFTHAADFMARTVVANALFLGRGKASALNIPWSTYTSPEIAHVGWTVAQAIEKNVPIDTYQVDMAENDRSILEGETDGFVKILTQKGKDKIVGATIVSPIAGDLISEVALAMNNNIGLKTLASTIHPYPTRCEAIRKCGDFYNRTRLTPFVKSLMEKWLTWTR